MLKAVIFDMDGVIIDSEPIHHKAYHQMFADINIEVPDRLYETFTGQSTLKICKRLCDEFYLDLNPEELMNIKRKHFKYLFENDPDLCLIDSVSDLIKEYYHNGLTLVLASSASMPNIIRVFKRFELDKYFVAKLSGADLKESKPHPEIFIRAVKKSGHNATECIVIEDSTNGVLAAKSANIFCVGFDSPHSNNQDYSKADIVINKFNDIRFNEVSKLL